jgi:type I restriction enzyme R subunit
MPNLIAWLEASGQGEKWAKLKKDNGDRALEILMDRLAKALETHGTVQVLRQGFSIAGCGHIDLSEAAPEDKRNADVLKRYAANILRQCRSFNTIHHASWRLIWCCSSTASR